MQEKVLFARIGYMKYYDGEQTGDEKPIGGGKYNNNNIGSEIFNFRNVKEKFYGFVQPPHKKDEYHKAKINITRIDPNCKNEFVEDVLVIFFCRSKTTKSQVIIGWYKNAHYCLETTA